jgi:hypothetical protein
VQEGLSQQNILYILITILQHPTSTAPVFTSSDAKTDPVKILDVNGPAVDCDDFQPEELAFGYIKSRLAGGLFEEPDQPLQAIDAIFPSIEGATLERVFQKWMDRLAQYCVADGDLIEGTEKSLRMIQVLLDQFRDANQCPPTPDTIIRRRVNIAWQVPQ